MQLKELYLLKITFCILELMLMSGKCPFIKTRTLWDSDKYQDTQCLAYFYKSLEQAVRNHNWRLNNIDDDVEHSFEGL